MKPTTFLLRFGADETWRAHLGGVRWPHGPVCDRCAAEHEFRWNRQQTDMADRIARCLISQHGRLSWNDLTA